MALHHIQQKSCMAADKDAAPKLSMPPLWEFTLTQLLKQQAEINPSR